MRYKSAALSLLFLLVIFGVGYAMSPDQPNMESARSDLNQARAELLVAEHNKGGHRGKALKLVNSAIAEVNRGIDYARTHNNHAQASELEAIFSALPDQPHMKSALDHLKDARNHLTAATPDKGGHRGKALDYVNRAIEEVNLGIAAAS